MEIEFRKGENYDPNSCKNNDSGICQSGLEIKAGGYTETLQLNTTSVWAREENKEKESCTFPLMKTAKAPVFKRPVRHQQGPIVRKPIKLILD